MLEVSPTRSGLMLWASMPSSWISSSAKALWPRWDDTRADPTAYQRDSREALAVGHVLVARRDAVEVGCAVEDPARLDGVEDVGISSSMKARPPTRARQAGLVAEEAAEADRRLLVLRHTDAADLRRPGGRPRRTARRRAGCRRHGPVDTSIFARCGAARIGAAMTGAFAPQLFAQVPEN
jgi:hypothetical protein